VKVPAQGTLDGLIQCEGGRRVAGEFHVSIKRSAFRFRNLRDATSSTATRDGCVTRLLQRSDLAWLEEAERRSAAMDADPNPEISYATFVAGMAIPGT